MNTVSTYKPPPKNVSGSTSSFIDWITKYDSLVILGGFGIVIIITII